MSKANRTCSNCQPFRISALLQLIIQLTIASSCPLNETQPISNKSRYDNYRLYNVHFENDEQVRVFQDLEERSDSCFYIGHARHPGQKLSILVAAHKIADVTDLLQRFNVEHEILSYNFQEKIDSQWRAVKPKCTPGKEFDWNHYFYLETIYDWLDQKVAEYPTILTIVNLGNSTNGVPVKGVRLSRQIGNSGVFLEGGIHAREWISPATATFLLNQLLTSTDPNVMEISQNYDWYIFPVVNPDGYKFTFESDRLWRKTRKAYGICHGADMNRNFDCHWNETGSSANSCRFDFAGGSAESEPETKLITNFILEHKEKANFRTYLALHSHAQMLMFPFGHTAEKPENYDDLLAIGQKSIDAFSKRYGTIYKTGSLHNIIHPSSGGSMNWAYLVAKIPVSYTMELRGPKTSADMFILPAEQITPTGWETLDAFVALLSEARKLGYYS